MPPLNLKLLLYNRLWELIEAVPGMDTLIKPGNRIKSTVVQSTPRDRIKSQGADYPKLRIKSLDNTTGQNIPRVFGQNDPNFNYSKCDYGIPQRFIFEVRVVHNVTDLALQSVIEAAVEAGLLSRGPKLGFTWVTSSVLRGIRRDDQRTNETGNSERTLCLWRFEIETRAKGSQLSPVP